MPAASSLPPNWIESVVVKRVASFAPVRQGCVIRHEAAPDDAALHAGPAVGDVRSVRPTVWVTVAAGLLYSYAPQRSFSELITTIHSSFPGMVKSE